MTPHKVFNKYKHVFSWKNIFFSITLTLFLFVLYIQHSYLFYVADDFCRKIQPASFKEIINASTYEYLTLTGRFTSSYLTYYFINGHFHYWKFLNPLFITSLVVVMLFSSRSIKIQPIGSVSALCYVIYFILTLNQYMAREVLYWMTGTLNYLWPLTLALLFIFFWENSFTKSKFAFYSKYASLLLAFFAGNSNEQVGIVFSVLMLIITFYKIKQGYKPDKIFYATLSIFFIGVISLLFAPGNFIRFNSKTDGQKLFYYGNLISILDIRLTEITNIIFLSEMAEMILNLFATFSVIAIFNLIFSIYKIKFISKFFLVSFFSLGGFVSLLIKPSSNWYMSVPLKHFFGTFSVFGTVFSMSTVTTYLFWTTFLISTIFLGIILFKSDKSLSFLLSVTGAVLSQLIMLFFPYSPYRTFFITSVFVAMAISYLIQRVRGEFLDLLIYIIMFAALLSGLSYYKHLTNNYQLNNQIMKDNEKIIIEDRETDSFHVLHLKKLANDLYNFDLPYVSRMDWDTQCFKNFYNIHKVANPVWDLH